MVLIATGFIFYVKSLDAEETEQTTEIVQENVFADDPVKVYVDECIKQAVRSAYVFGVQQGYHNLPSNSLDTGSI